MLERDNVKKHFDLFGRNVVRDSRRAAGRNKATGRGRRSIRYDAECDQG